MSEPSEHDFTARADEIAAGYVREGDVEGALEITRTGYYWAGVCDAARFAKGA